MPTGRQLELEFSSHATVAVATTSTLISTKRLRAYMLIVNDSDTVVYLSLGVAADLNAGIRLNASGGSYEMSWRFGNNFPGNIYAIHGGTGTKNLLVTEDV